MTTDEAIQATFTFQGRRENLPWYPRQGDRNRLVQVFHTLGFTAGVEIGTWAGEFAAFICRTNPQVHLTCVDPWLAYHEQPKQRSMDAYYAQAVERLAPLNVTILKKSSMEALPDVADRSLDFVYIDGAHQFDYVIQDLIHWTKKVKVGGIIAGHDYYAFGGTGVVKAVDAYTHCHDIRPWYVTKEIAPTFFWVNR